MNVTKQQPHYIPLANRMRPTILDDYYGHEELVGNNSWLRAAIKHDRISSMILWGPPGSGKTTLASIIAHETTALFVELSGVSCGKQDLMTVIKQAQDNHRLLRFASEDVGLADNFALVLANATFDAYHKIGMPECTVHLTQLVIYLAQAKKSVAAYFAYGKAKKDVQAFGNLPVPLHIRNAPTKLMEKLGYGKGYKYTPLEDSSEQEYFPDELKEKKYL